MFGACTQTDLWVHQIRWKLERLCNWCLRRRLSRPCCWDKVGRRWVEPAGHVELVVWCLFHTWRCIRPSRPTGRPASSQRLHDHTSQHNDDMMTMTQPNDRLPANNSWSARRSWRPLTLQRGSPLGDDCFNCSRHHDFSSQVQIRLLFLQ